MDRWMERWTGIWIEGGKDGGREGKREGGIDGQVDGWMERWMEGDRRNEWMDGCIRGPQEQPKVSRCSGPRGQLVFG